MLQHRIRPTIQSCAAGLQLVGLVLVLGAICLVAEDAWTEVLILCGHFKQECRQVLRGPMGVSAG